MVSEMLHIVSYDIVETKKRTKIAKALTSYGKRVQYSVFECDVELKKLEELKKRVLPFVDLEKDSLRIYRLCQACTSQIESYGVKKGWEDEEEVVIF